MERFCFGDDFARLPGGASSDGFMEDFMKQRMPEGVAVVSESEQYERLLQMLIGQKVFGRMRGRFVISPADLIGELSKDVVGKSSPTSILRMYDKHFADARVMTNMLAKLKRDGLDHAGEALLNALSDREYVLPGETVLIEETETYTLVMFEPKKTFAFLRLVAGGQVFLEYLKTGSWLKVAIEINRRAGRLIAEEHWDATAWSRAVNEFFKSFPGSWDLINRHCNNDQESVFEWVTRVFQDGVSLTNKSEPLLKAGINFYFFFLATKLGYCDVGIQSDMSVPCMVLVSGGQKDVLRCYSREQQENMATWQLHIPKIFGRRPDSIIHIGLHPESEHEMWRKRAPALTSRHCNHGCGVYFGNCKNSPEYFDGKAVFDGRGRMFFS